MAVSKEWLKEWLGDDEECDYCGQPFLERTINYDTCMNCGYWHCYTDGEGWVPPHYRKKEGLLIC